MDTQSKKLSIKLTKQIEFEEPNIPKYNEKQSLSVILTNDLLTKNYFLDDNIDYDITKHHDDLKYENLIKTWKNRDHITNSNQQFFWGSATSCFQIEGSFKEGNRQKSIWDDFGITTEDIKNDDSAAIACNSFNQFKDDRDLLLNMNCNSSRISLAWTRIISYDKYLKPSINMDGITHYKKVLIDLKKNGIEPFVTLFHWDTPQVLEDAYGGWNCQNKEIIKDFVFYADTCFKYFGHLVKHWFTFNETQTYAVDGVEFNWFAPAIGNSDGISTDGREYLCAHNQILAHAYAVDSYRNNFFDQNGKIGMVCNCDGSLPFDKHSKKDRDAADRNFEFWFCWFYDPFFFGEYPKIMRDLVGDRLPEFTTEEKELVQGSIDFIAWNTYTLKFFQYTKFSDSQQGWVYDQQSTALTVNSEGKSNGLPTQSSWLQITPYAPAITLNRMIERYGIEGKKGIQLKLKNGSYKELSLFITEFGMDVLDQDKSTTYDVCKKDYERIFYYDSYFKNISKGIKETGITLEGIFPWSLEDNYEWASKYGCRFGLNYVDFLTKCKKDPKYRQRLPKFSAIWYKEYIKNHPNGL